MPFDEIDITDVDLDFIKNIRIEELYKYQSFSPEYIGENRSLVSCKPLPQNEFRKILLQLSDGKKASSGL